MFRRSASSLATKLIVACALLLCARIARAQHHGGHGVGGGIPGASNRPTGVDEKDDLKDFHRAMAVQATSQQISEFQALVKETDAVKTKLASFVQTRRNAGSGSQPIVSAAEIDQS